MPSALINASNRATLDARARALFSEIGRPGGLPPWPGQEIQKKYNGVHGMPLMVRTLRFVDALEADGAFARSDWKGLDYGCGWGRVASVLTRKGTPEQLDLCDAWPQSISLVETLGHDNRCFLVPEVLAADSIPEAAYDFIYAHSVFTHLREDVFINNIKWLTSGLKEGGRVYFTVRHEEYLDHLKAPAQARAVLARSGLWFQPSGTNPVFGKTVVAPDYLGRQAFLSDLRYLGAVVEHQHLYTARRTDPGE
jgi:2-polyprenyl-3-methyl-5-hydroxy-6-metoxy-1,4-benzoquinol methylase